MNVTCTINYKGFSINTFAKTSDADICHGKQAYAAASNDFGIMTWKYSVLS